MKRYKLKEEARRYLLSQYRYSICSLDEWNEMGVNIDALEPVLEAKIIKGYKKSSHMKDVSQWDIDNGTDIYLTLNVQGISIQDHERLTSSENIDKIIDMLNKALEKYLNI